MTDTTRGRRFQGLLVEEAATVDQDKLNEIIMPTLVISRTVNGHADPNEVLNQSAMFVTSAGWKNTYSYNKMIQTLCEMVVDPRKSFLIGGDYKIPVVEGLQPANFIQSQELDVSVSEDGFDREYNSVWGGTLDGAFFDPQMFDRNRIINLPKNSYDHGITKGYYVLGVDVGRKDDQTEIVVIEANPRSVSGNYLKKVVNIYTLANEHFSLQAVKIKKLIRDFSADMCVIDANGLGAGLIDYLVMDQVDPDTGEDLPNLGIYNDEDGKYSQFKTPNTVKNALYLMYANAPLNSQMFSYCKTQLKNGNLKFLIDESSAKAKLMAQAQGKKMTPSQREDYLRPYVETSILRTQLLNLVQNNEGQNIILKQHNINIKKDKFSALIYGLWWCHETEVKRNRRNGSSIADYMFFTKKK